MKCSNQNKNSANFKPFQEHKQIKTPSISDSAQQARMHWKERGSIFDTG